MKQIVRYIFFILFGYTLLFSCKNKKLETDVSHIKVDLKIKRLDQDLFEFKFKDSLSSLDRLSRKYGEFFNLYNYRMIKLGSQKDHSYVGYLREFITNDMIKELKTKTDSVFEDISPLQGLLEDAFKHYNYYFPQRPVPEIYTCISGFNQSIVTAEGAIGVSLEKYLGADCSFYQVISPPVPAYQRANMHPGKIAVDCMYAWAITEFPMDVSKHNLLSRMIHQGKMMYFLDAMMPTSEDSIKIGYTQKQLEWCENNQGGMWTFLVENKMIYSTNRIDIRRYMDNAPFTSSFSAESPGRTGVWIGWQIVQGYMDKNPDVTIPDLMNNHDYQSILNHSGYNPGQ